MGKDKEIEECRRIIQYLEHENRRLRTENMELQVPAEQVVKEFVEILLSIFWEEYKEEAIKIKDLHSVVKDVAKVHFGVEIDK